MSVSGAGNSNFISNESILVWMETKTDAIYGHMRESMDTSNRRAEAEDALNTAKAKLVDAATRHLPIDEAINLVNETLKEYGDEFPQVQEALQSIADELNPQQEAYLAALANVGVPAQDEIGNGVGPQPQMDRAGNYPVSVNSGAPAAAPSPVTVSKEQTEPWSKQISDKVDALAKQDQLGLINIQEFNAQLNQAKQTASALMDAASKSASAIISNIG